MKAVFKVDFEPEGCVVVSLIFLVTVTFLSGLLILVLAFNLCSSDILR